MAACDGVYAQNAVSHPAIHPAIHSFRPFFLYLNLGLFLDHLA
jgi:hypothetical protein